MEDVLKLYREELARVQAERDRAVAGARKLSVAAFRLKGVAESLLSTVRLAKEASQNDEFLRYETMGVLIDNAQIDLDGVDEVLDVYAGQPT
ncbi:unnamed protein product [Gemmataceae bacterium]|nr:unnamed protein product [Gemmataceae bacterium]VTT96522.1 unnamed protein product [Gemmataceae bacterium]